jgi:HEAT repeat protein
MIQLKGVTMVKAFGVILAAALLSSGKGENALSAIPFNNHESAGRAFIDERDPIDVNALLTAAKGAPLLICSLASQSVRNGNWGESTDAPATPLGSATVTRDYDYRSDALPASDVKTLLEALSSDDPCVRELSVRVLTRNRNPGIVQGNQEIVDGLISRLSAESSPLREVSAFGLGLVHSAVSVDPLIHSLRDATPEVRANSAWALGRLDAGRALTPLLNLFSDQSATVRRAAVGAVGHIDSTRSAPTLMRVVKQDPAPEVRRVAAWALGQLESSESVDVLASVLSEDNDGRVREMAAWALGSIESGRGATALLTAAQKDADDHVRETAVWAIGQLEDNSLADKLGSIAASDRSERVRGTAAWAIGQLRGDGGHAPAGLLGLLKDPDDDTRLKAAWALGQIGDPNALPAIHSALNQEKDEQVSRALVRALLKSGEKSEAALTQLLNSKDARVRESAVRGLAGRESFNPWPWPWPRPRPFP